MTTRTADPPSVDQQRSLSRMAARTFSKYGTIIALVVMAVGFSIALPGLFLTPQNLTNVLSQVAIGGIVACGLTVCLASGEFDLSIGFVTSFAGVLVTGFISFQHLPMPAAMLATLAVGAIIGLVNGAIVTGARVSSFIATLGVGTVIVGLNFAYNSGAPVTLGLPDEFKQMSLARVFGIPVPVLVMLAVALVLSLLLNRTVLGKNIQAVGGNPEAARLAGVHVDRTRIAALTICSTCAALAGILLASKLGSGQYNAGDGYMLDAFAAAFLGTVALKDGQFHIAGTLIGILTVGVAFNGLALMGAPTFYQFLFKGTLLIVAVAVSTVARRALAR